jgi:hypothetical protein
MAAITMAKVNNATPLYCRILFSCTTIKLGMQSSGSVATLLVPYLLVAAADCRL